MAEFRALPSHEQALLREGILEEFARRSWDEAVTEDAYPEAPEQPPVIPADPAEDPHLRTDNSLAALAEVGFTVMEV